LGPVEGFQEMAHLFGKEPLIGLDRPVAGGRLGQLGEEVHLRVPIVLGGALQQLPKQSFRRTVAQDRRNRVDHEGVSPEGLDRKPKLRKTLQPVSQLGGLPGQKFHHHRLNQPLGRLTG